jgi:hypothetical protein
MPEHLVRSLRHGVWSRLAVRIWFFCVGSYARCMCCKLVPLINEIRTQGAFHKKKTSSVYIYTPLASISLVTVWTVVELDHSVA